MRAIDSVRLTRTELRAFGSQDFAAAMVVVVAVAVVSAVQINARSKISTKWFTIRDGNNQQHYTRY